MSERLEIEKVDRRLRERFEPGAEAVHRVTRAALSSGNRQQAHRRPLLRPVAVAAALAAGAGLGLWLYRPAAPPPARPASAAFEIANFGEIVTVVDPEGSVWIGGPSRFVDPSAPRLIVRLGESHAYAP